MWNLKNPNSWKQIMLPDTGAGVGKQGSVVPDARFLLLTTPLFPGQLDVSSAV